MFLIHDMSSSSTMIVRNSNAVLPLNLDKILQHTALQVWKQCEQNFLGFQDELTRLDAQICDYINKAYAPLLLLWDKCMNHAYDVYFKFYFQEINVDEEQATVHRKSIQLLLLLLYDVLYCLEQQVKTYHQVQLRLKSAITPVFIARLQNQVLVLPVCLLFSSQLQLDCEVVHRLDHFKWRCNIHMTKCTIKTPDKDPPGPPYQVVLGLRLGHDEWAFSSLSSLFANLENYVVTSALDSFFFFLSIFLQQSDTSSISADSYLESCMCLLEVIDSLNRWLIPSLYPHSVLVKRLRKLDFVNTLVLPFIGTTGRTGTTGDNTTQLHLLKLGVRLKTWDSFFRIEQSTHSLPCQTSSSLYIHTRFVAKPVDKCEPWTHSRPSFLSFCVQEHPLDQMFAAVAGNNRDCPFVHCCFDYFCCQKNLSFIRCVFQDEDKRFVKTNGNSYSITNVSRSFVTPSPPFILLSPQLAARKQAEIRENLSHDKTKTWNNMYRRLHYAMSHTSNTALLKWKYFICKEVIHLKRCWKSRKSTEINGSMSLFKKTERSTSKRPLSLSSEELVACSPKQNDSSSFKIIIENVDASQLSKKPKLLY